MKRTNFFYHVLIVLGLFVFAACGNESRSGAGSSMDNGDSTAGMMPAATDSMNAASHNDPSTAYPQPPVTGSATDSSRTQDSTHGHAKDSVHK